MIDKLVVQKNGLKIVLGLYVNNWPNVKISSAKKQWCVNIFN